MIRWATLPTAGALAALMLAGSLAALLMGPMSLPASESLWLFWDWLSGSEISQLNEYERVVVMELRLPRLALGLLVGALLAQCGAVMQGLFRNPLADPGIIGVSSGAALGAICAIVLLPAGMLTLGVPLSAFVGGLGATLLVYGLAQSTHGTSVMILLLAGIAIAAFSGSVIGFASYFASDQSLREVSLWQMGSLTRAQTPALAVCFLTLVGITVFFQSQAKALNALLLGEAEARHLGIHIERLKLHLIVASALGVGVAVASSGIIGFVGLVVPHLIRLVAGPDHRRLLPLSALLGAALLVIADLLARLLVQPAELPVGLVTAFLGAPFLSSCCCVSRNTPNDDGPP